VIEVPDLVNWYRRRSGLLLDEQGGQKHVQFFDTT
jgi:hypothetical protein